MAFPNQSDPNKVVLAALSTSGSYGVLSTVTSSIPFPWATGDVIYVAGVYEAAA
jgi:hypothetical protein